MMAMTVPSAVANNQRKLSHLVNLVISVGAELRTIDDDDSDDSSLVKNHRNFQHCAQFFETVNMHEVQKKTMFF